MNTVDRLCKRVANEAYFTDGPFHLASGGTSDFLIDCSQVLRRGDVMREVAILFAGWLRNCDAVGGPALGADPLAAALAMELGIRWFSVRPAPKNRGRDTGLITGPLFAGDRVGIVEDVLTTGASLTRAVRACREADATIAAIGVLVARIDFRPIAAAYQAMGVDFFCLFTLPMLQAARVGE